MPRYWILSMTEDNYLITKERCLIGMSRVGRRAIQQMGIGDMITFYLSRKKVDSPRNNPLERIQQFRGIARVSGEAFESDEMIWPARGVEIFPHRRSVEFISDAMAEAKLLIEKFSFVTNTPSHTMQKRWNMDKPAMVARHILFQEEDQDTYVRAMFEAVIPAGMTTTADAVPS